MTHTEYQNKLTKLREEYAAAIRCASDRTDGIDLIDRVQFECSEYRARVQQLIAEYQVVPV